MWCLNKRLKNGKLRGKKAQVTLEIALGLVCVFILLFGAVKIFMWANNRFIMRQEDYEKTRVTAGSSNPGLEVDESAYPKLDIFGTTD